jgi:membrane-bound lytic murein transglycosylase D
MSTKIPIATDTVVVTRDVHIDQIIAYCNIEKESIKSLNPQYKTNIIPGSSEPRVLRMTQQAILEFTENEDSIYAYKADELIKRRTTVVPKTTGSSTQSSSQKKSSGSKYYKKSYSRRKR